MYELLDNKLFFQSFHCVKYLTVSLPQTLQCQLMARCVIEKKKARLLDLHLICSDLHWCYLHFF